MEPSKKNPEIRRIQSTIMNVDVLSAIKADTCVFCRNPAIEFKDEVSRREFTISGLCQSCQDKLFEVPEDEEG